MRFASPIALTALSAVALLGLAYVVVERRRRHAADVFASRATRRSVVPRSARWRRHAPIALLLAGLSSMTLAAARPFAEVRTPVDRATVMLVMDASRSMELTDVSPSRLAAAQAAARAFLQELPDPFRVGVVAFAGTARPVAVPTTSREDVERSIEALETSRGTLIGDALAAGLRQLESLWREEERPAPAAVLLLSDGRDTGSAIAPAEAAQRARSAGVPVYTILTGNPTTGERPPDAGLLRDVAEVSGGEAFVAPTAGDLARVYADLGSRLTYERGEEEVSAWFLAAGIAFVAVASGASTIWFRRVL